jgi:hypothetical protein
METLCLGTADRMTAKDAGGGIAAKPKFSGRSTMSMFTWQRLAEGLKGEPK